MHNRLGRFESRLRDVDCETRNTCAGAGRRIGCPLWPCQARIHRGVGSSPTSARRPARSPGVGQRWRRRAWSGWATRALTGLCPGLAEPSRSPTAASGTGRQLFMLRTTGGFDHHAIGSLNFLYRTKWIDAVDRCEQSSGMQVAGGARRAMLLANPQSSYIVYSHTRLKDNSLIVQELRNSGELTPPGRTTPNPVWVDRKDNAGESHVGLDPNTRRALPLRRRRHHASHPRRGQGPMQPEPGRAHTVKFPLLPGLMVPSVV